MEGITSRLETIASRLEAIGITSCAKPLGQKPGFIALATTSLRGRRRACRRGRLVSRPERTCQGLSETRRVKLLEHLQV